MTPSAADPLLPLLVVGLTGKLGAGVSFVRDKLQQQLQTFSYRVVNVDVSRSFLVEAYNQNNFSASTEETFDAEFTDNAARIRELQRRGNELRAAHGDDIIARLCVDFIADDLGKEGETKRTAFLVDSLKRPEEVDLLRHVFGSAFVAVAVMSSAAKRKERLLQRKALSEDELDVLSEIDADQQVAHGQKASDAILRADYFLANDYSTKEELGKETDRLLRLLFNVGIVSPTVDEFGMHVAYEAAARSACLSRQVGAAIFSKDGRILSTGCNDVPRFGGGLYPSPTDDKRCWTLSGKCYNDEEKRLILDQLMEVIGEVIDLGGAVPLKSGAGNSQGDGERDEPLSVEARLRRALAGSRVKSLIEFSRAVHAEMDAMLALARGGETGIVGSTLYCTNYPCHYCAKHVIAAGIMRVVYLEPYEKSLARKLHFDAISDPLATPAANEGLVAIDAYNGVAPARYNSFFAMRGARKDTRGAFIDHDRHRGSLIHLGAQPMSELRSRMEAVSNILSKGTRSGTNEHIVAAEQQAEQHSEPGAENRA